MAFVQHLSVRVPWHDSGWTGRVCGDPLANTSCVMLENIGTKRKGQQEASQAGADWDTVLGALPPCVTERGSFMSSRDHWFERTHPYSGFQALRGLGKSRVHVPAYSVHGIPYFWLHRGNVETVLQERPLEGYRAEDEERALEMLGNPRLQWVLHGDNQRAMIEEFFRQVQPERSLVFLYLKHSPFEQQPRRMLVGAAQVTDRTAPGRWPGSDERIFPNQQWETVLRHSLRPGGAGGILLPVQALARLAAEGTDVGGSLAAAPEVGRNFSYSTEHVSADTAVAALLELRRAARAAVDLKDPSVFVPQASLEWLDEQLRLAWKRRGVAPGLPAVLDRLRVPHPTFAAHAITSALGDGTDPWPALEQLLERRGGDAGLAKLVTSTPAALWAAKSPQERQALRLLSRFDVTPDAAERVLTGRTSIDIPADALLANPYDLVTCTVDDGEPIPFETVDRGCFPDRQITERHPLPVTSPFEDANDPRRIDAAMTAVLARAAQDEGHTLLPLEQMQERLDALLPRLTTAFDTAADTLGPLGLLPRDLEQPGGDTSRWLQLRRVDVAGDSAAYKLESAALRRDFIRDRLNEIRNRRPHPAPADLDAALDAVLASSAGAADADAAVEEQGRQEKHAAFRVLYTSPLTVLNGRAGTGKTTLIRALARRPEIRAGRLLLLAPTGKARVQLQKKADHDAQTLAQFLTPNRFDAHGRYLTLPDGPRERYDTVVVDEASMLTEDMLAALLDAVDITDRLILVGDPRQLPPIGAGRPFVDIERFLRPDQPIWPRTAAYWAELTVLHRQRGRDRDDLALAHWYSGDERTDDDRAIWEQLRSGRPMASVRVVPWAGRSAARVLEEVLREEFGVSDALTFAQSYGASTRRGKDGRLWPAFGSAPAGCDTWQVLSPVRGRSHGTVGLNRHLKDLYRQHDLALATVRGNRWVPKPLGPEQIVHGDKVVNTTNRTLNAYNNTAPSQERRARRYVANGELGVVTGQLKAKGMKSAPWETQVEFSSQPGWTFSYRGAKDEPGLELAWAMTVHKSQGSEFATVVLMLPAGLQGISRELLYTALTRQTERVVICHEGPLDDLLELAAPTASDTARRLTDLVTPPRPKVAMDRRGGVLGVFDANLIHLTHFGLAVQSKNEVIIANLLDRNARGRWEYERPVSAGDGSWRLPDFTIFTDDPDRPIYWEHLGMLNDAAYKAKWQRKEEWYARQGILPAPEGGPGGILLVTDDLNGVDEPAWEARFKTIYRPQAAVRPRTVTRRTSPGR
ncbi:AAA family ATPase [Kitasatospora indigofera]|uniref:AAA family ATPase n=1 Tax=Kitasatospora indigofera TaxID=67307 RepID=UPI0033ABBBA9